MNSVMDGLPNKMDYSIRRWGVLQSVRQSMWTVFLSLFVAHFITLNRNNSDFALPSGTFLGPV